MATQKPISTISYNSEAFLRERLDDWVDQHIIQAYQYIFHKGEDGDKDHIHLRIEPNKKLDPMDLSEALKEYVIDNPKPLGCRPWRPSKEEDWFLYAVHDPDYLKLKYQGGEKGEKLPYQWQDIKASDSYDVEVAFIRAKASLNHSTPQMATRLRSGADPINLIMQGENPYVINALMRALGETDYSRALKELAEAQNRIDKLIQAITDRGLIIVSDDQGNLTLEDQTPLNNAVDTYHFTELPEGDELPW